MPIIAKIGVTGGPAGGKTYFTNYSREIFSNLGLRPVYVSEVATLFQNYGIGPISKVLNNLEYQYMVAKFQLSIEDVLLKSLEKSEDKILLVFDRTVLDGKAYCTAEEWKIVLDRIGITEQDIYSRYDLVLHFVTTAIGKFNNYSTENNFARHETVSQATERENCTVIAYNGMPINKKVYLNNDVNMEEKQRRAVDIVLGFLNMAKPIFECQKKYLVKKISKEEIAKFSPKKIRIVQDYLHRRDYEIERRIRCITDDGNKSYYYTEKCSRGVSYETQISCEEYYSYLKDKNGKTKTIRKNRWYFQASDSYFQYDEFEFWNEFAILEVQPTKICIEVVIPEEFEVIQDVTDLSFMLKNEALSRDSIKEEELKDLFCRK